MIYYNGNQRYYLKQVPQLLKTSQGLTIPILNYYSFKPLISLPAMTPKMLGKTTVQLDGLCMDMVELKLP